MSRPLPAPVLYEDRHLVVLDKPSGPPVIPSRTGEAGLLDGSGLLLCHRLDADTSGVLVTARSAAGQRLLSAAFEQRRVRKGYVAIAVGDLADEGICALPLGDWQRGRVAIGRGREARTAWTVRARCGDRVWVEARPHTGRTHQVRAHLAASGAPLAGDEAYGGPPSPRIALHAAWIELPWPNRDDCLRISAPLPPDFLALWPGEAP